MGILYKNKSKLKTVLVVSFFSTLVACADLFEDDDDFNQAPTSDAGADQSIAENTLATLSGSGADTDGSIVSYAWSQGGGTAVTISDANSATASFTTPEVSAEGEELTFFLAVADNKGITGVDSVVVTVTNVNISPVSNAGADISIDENSAVSLVGVASDADGSVASVLWEQTGGTAVTLAEADSLTASFTTPEVVSEETLTFSLTVTDELGTSATDTVSVVVSNVNKLPLVAAGSSFSANENSLASLIGMASDTDGSIASVQWAQLSGASVTLDDSTSLSAMFLVPEVVSDEPLSFRLTVTDNEGASSFSDITITAINVNKIPLVDVGSDQSSNENTNVSLVGTASDLDGSITSAAWVQISGPAVVLSSTTNLATSFTSPEVIDSEQLVFELTVTDNEGASASASKTVTVLNVNKVPTADAGENISINENLAVNLSGTASDLDGSIATVAWEQTGGTAVTLADASSLTPSFTAPEVVSSEELVFQLTVTDNEGASTSSDITVTVLNVNKAPEVNAGADFSVDENATATFSAVASDPDGSIASIAWLQLSGTSVTIDSASSLTASFTAPSVSEDEILTFEVSVTDNEGATASDQVAVTVEALSGPLISNLSPSFGLAGTVVTVQANATIATDTVINFSGVEVTPDDIDDMTLEFTVPVGAATGFVSLSLDNENSNRLAFRVSDQGLAPASDDGVISLDEGGRIVSEYLIVVLEDTSNNQTEAERVAALVSGSVIGKIELLNAWQISISASTLDEITSLSTTLEADTAVSFVVQDIEVDREAIDWSMDVDRTAQRARNRVEEGVALYETSVSRDVADNLVLPFFMAIGVAEKGVDFSLTDFDQYVANEGVSNGVNLYAGSTGSTGNQGRHVNNVVGQIAAELGDSGNAGPIAALADSHGGANISVASGVPGGFSGLAGRLEATLAQLEAGATVVNWSFGGHRSGLSTCTGAAFGGAVYPAAVFDNNVMLLNQFFDTLATEHPQAVIVSSAGNASTDATVTNGRLPSSIVSDQMIVVGAHTTEGTILDGTVATEDQYSAGFCFDSTSDADIKRAFYSNYGERVDISASGAITGFDNLDHAQSFDSTDSYRNTGTSFAAPVVTSAVALIQSINPNLTPLEIKNLLRSTALPIYNTVEVDGGSSAVFTRALTTEESADNAGMGARLNFEAAIQAALDSLETETLPRAETVQVSIPNGDSSVTQTIQVTMPSDGPIFNSVDVMFIVDISGSYSDDLATFRTQASAITDAFASAGEDVQIGVSSFSDFPVSPFGASFDIAYNLDQALTSDFSKISTALDSLTILSGFDFPESQLEAVFQTAQPESGWREGALPVIFLATDASFHDSDDEPTYPGTGFTEVLEYLNDNKFTVFGLESGGSIVDVDTLTSSTGGEAFTMSRDSAEVVDSVLSAIDVASSDLTIALDPIGDFNGLVDSITPLGDNVSGDGTAITNVNAGDTIEFSVTFDRGSLQPDVEHVLTFRLLVNADDVAVIQEIPVVISLN